MPLNTTDPVLSWIVDNPILFGLLAVWSLIWKGLALWRAAGLRHKWWFVIILLVNDLGILEIIYLYFIARKYKVEVVEN